MFGIEIDIEGLRKQIKRAVDDADKLVNYTMSNVLMENINTVRASMQEILERELDNLQYVHSSDAWRRKKEQMLSGEIPMQEYERLNNGGMEEIKFAENWKATGIMAEILPHILRNVRPQVNVSPGLQAEASFTMDLSTFVTGEDGLPYPLSADAKIRERSGGEFGVMAFSQSGQREMLDVFVSEVLEAFKRGASMYFLGDKK